jgi:hypothetical protein
MITPRNFARRFALENSLTALEKADEAERL